MNFRNLTSPRGHPLAFAGALIIAAALLLIAAGDAQSQSRRSHGDSEGDSVRIVTFNREVFRYDPAGRRDPFVSLVKSSELRPTMGDLRLTTVALDPTGRNSVAVLRDIGTKEQYRVRVGASLGRMRVVRIDQKAVTFALEEYGFSRQETLAMGDSTLKRTP